MSARGFALAEEGTVTRLIQDFLGHKDIKSTVTYTETYQRRLAGVRVRWMSGMTAVGSFYSWSRAVTSQAVPHRFS